MFFHRRAEGKADDAVVDLTDQTQFAVGIEQGGDFVFIPGAIQSRKQIGGKDLLADMKHLGQIVDGHFPNA
jgi:hypothetical protein